MKYRVLKKILPAAVIFALAAPTAAYQTAPGTACVSEAKTKAKLTKKQAFKKVLKYLKKKKIRCKKFCWTYAGIEGKRYLFHVFEDMETHTATIGWYYVNKNTGKVTSMF